MTGPARRVLVLSGSIGRGHDSVADACAAALEASGQEVAVVDSLALLGRGGAALGRAVFRRLLGLPGVFDGLHFAHLRAGGRLGRVVEGLTARRLVDGLGALVASYRPGTVISVFAGGVGAVGRVRHLLPPGATTVAFCTDATAHRLWTHPGIDVYLACSDLAAATVHEYAPDRPLAVLPPPVRTGFYGAPARDEARRVLGLGPGAGDGPRRPVALLMAGGWGVAPLATVAEALARDGVAVLAVAGANRRLAGRLEALGGRGLPVTAFGVTEQVPLLMAASDVVVTSAGQTCHEARVVGRPLVVLDVVPGHGRENALLEVGKGGAVPSTAEPGSVVAAVRTAFATGPTGPGAGGPAPWVPAPPVPWPVSSASQWAGRFLAALGTTGPGADRGSAPGGGPASGRPAPEPPPAVSGR